MPDDTSTPTEGPPIVPGSVMVAYLHPNDVAHSWHHSYVDLLGYDIAHHQRVIRAGQIEIKVGTGGVDIGRNLAAARFLRESDAEWLFWIDADMGFAPDTVDRLVEAAHPVDRPIVGALAFAQSEQEPDGYRGYRCIPRPTLFDWVTNGQGKTGFAARSEYPVNTIAQVSGTGSACILIHRTVLEKVAEVAEGPIWYQRILNPSTGEWISEDLSFCVRAANAGFPIYVDTSVKTTHQKTLWLGEPDFWAWRSNPPATAETAVLVPVALRPDNAAPFMATLRASTGLATVYAIVDLADFATGKAWEDAGATVLAFHPDPDDDDTAARVMNRTEDGALVGTFAQKVNYGFTKTTEPFVFIVGDDVRFHPGWLDAAQHTADISSAGVVGTNDLGSPRVTSGEHATHMLLRRAYIDAAGGSWGDRPGEIASEVYHHWFVDDEIVTAAKQRGQWAMSLGSVVEHLHPAWGKAPEDEVYMLGQRWQHADQKTFRRRLRASRKEGSQ